MIGFQGNTFARSIYEKRGELWLSAFFDIRFKNQISRLPQRKR